MHTARLLLVQHIMKTVFPAAWGPVEAAQGTHLLQTEGLEFVLDVWNGWAGSPAVFLQQLGSLQTLCKLGAVRQIRVVAWHDTRVAVEACDPWDVEEAIAGLPRALLQFEHAPAPAV